MTERGVLPCMALGLDDPASFRRTLGLNIEYASRKPGQLVETALRMGR